VRFIMFGGELNCKSGLIKLQRDLRCIKVWLNDFTYCREDYKGVLLIHRNLA